MHVSRRIEGKNATAANLTCLLVAELSRPKDVSIFVEGDATGRLLRRGRMQASLEGEQDSFLPLRREFVDDASPATTTNCNAIQVAGCIDGQCAGWKLSRVATIE